MKKSDINQPPSYFDRYINLVDDIELMDALKQSIAELDNLDLAPLNKIADMAYAKGKWTVKDVFQHLIDTERVMNYRALSFGRNDVFQLPGFDQDVYANHVSTQKRNLRNLIAELKMLHRSSIALFKSFDDKALMRSGTMYNSPMSVLGIGFILAGHQKYHLKIINEKYLPLLNS
ncbi:MAG: DinB family protein [Saprospiraceae bacterium]|nr:DinB family protein [Saprospiraceae bacterium]